MAYHSRVRSEEFALQWEEALQDAIDVLESEARRRALGQSDTLLIFLLKSHRPEVYRENYHVTHTGPDGGAIHVDQTILLEKLKRIAERGVVDGESYVVNEEEC